MKKTRELLVSLYGKPTGILSKDLEGKMYFQYLSDAHQAISLSMPLKAEIFEHRVCRSYFGGLLPQDKTILHKFCENYQIRPVTIFNILKVMGRDCLGAITFSNEKTNIPFIDKIDAVPVKAKKMLSIFKACSADIYCNPTYKYIYPFCSNMIPICMIDGEVAIPQQGLSTHFIKLSNSSSVINQYIYLHVAKKIGIDVPEVSLHRLEEFYYLIIPRLDRFMRVDHTIQRLHQESFTQSLGPRKVKAQAINREFIKACFQLCNKTTIPALNRNALAKLILFNYLMHDLSEIRNYSLLYDTPHYIRLGSFLDISLERGSEGKIEDYNWQEICLENGYSYKAFKKMLFEGRDKLKESLALTVNEVRKAGFEVNK